MKKLILIFIALSTFAIHGLCESQTMATYLKKIDLKDRPRDPAYIKKTKQQLRELKWESALLEKKCRADTKKYFVENCARSREKISKRTEALVRELASAPPLK